MISEKNAPPGGAVKKRSPARRMACLAALLCAAAGLAAVSGAYRLSLGEIGESLAAHILGVETTLAKARDVVVWNIRLPRIALAAVSGTALAVSGAAYQGCFRNPLVEPYILGVSSGAAFGAALAILFPHAAPPLAASAFLAALAAVSLAGLLARARNTIPPVALVLSGVIVGSLFAAGVGMLKYFSSDAELREITFWMMGGFHYASWEDVRLVASAALPCAALIWAASWRLNVLSLGDDEARSLGVNPVATRRLVVVLATVCAASCVAVAGVIGWVGLMAPHAARMVFGPDNRWAVPAAALMGAAYLLLCDTAARTLAPAEIPVGIVAAILGSPYLLWLLRVKGRELYGA